MKILKKALPALLAVSVLFSSTLITMGALGIGIFAEPTNIAATMLATDTVLIPLDATWKYNTNDPGANWKNTNFDDSSWNSGQGPLGYGYDSTVGYIPTTKVVAPASGSRNTTYFRTSFNITNKTDLSNLKFEGETDDGAIYYLNGHEIARLGVATGETHTTSSSANVNKLPNGDATLDKIISGTELQSYLVAGTNVISVRVHQLTNTSSDMYMQLKVTANIEISEYMYRTLGIQPGKTRLDRGFVWYAPTSNEGTAQLQIVKESELDGGKFPSTGVESINAIVSAASTGFNTNKVSVDGLEENTTYAYRVGNGTLWSEVFKFKTQSAQGDYNFIFIGDAQIGASGNSNTDSLLWRGTVNKALTMFPDTAFIASAGDQVDSGGSEDQYLGFFSPPELRSVPFAPTVGNHDNPHANFVHHYNVPNPGTYKETNSGPNYYYVYGNSLFMHLNLGNMDTTVNTAQQEAFIKDAIANSPGVIWKFIVMHYDIYGSGNNHSTRDYTERMRRSLFPIFDRNEIDVALTGHDHVFTRSHQMLGNEPQLAQTTDDMGALINPNGIFYFTANSSSGSKYYELAPVAQQWVAARSQLKTPTFSNVQITDTSFKIQTYRSDSGELLDTFSILKVASKEALEAAIEAGKSIVEADYSAESYALFKIAFEAAKALGESATDTEISTALNNLKTAQNSLVRVADKYLLKEKIDTATALYDYSVEGPGEEQYQPGSKAILKVAIDVAKAVYDKGNSTQEEVNSQVTVLGDAINTFTTSINGQLVEEEEESSTPQSSTPQVSTPESSTPQVSTPESSTPQVSTPQTSTPQTSTPQVSTPQTTSSKPESGTPGTSNPVSSSPVIPSGDVIVNNDGNYITGPWLPENGSLRITNVVEEEKIGNVKEAIPQNDNGKNYQFITLFDISVLDENGDIVDLNNGSYLIAIPFGNFDGDINRTYEVFYYNEETGTVEKMNAYEEDGYLKFITTHLSMYAITEVVSADTSTASGGKNPGTGDNFPVVAVSISFVALLGLSSVVAYKKSKQH